MSEHDHATIKILIAWVGAIYGALTLSQLVLFATLVYTVLQIVVLVRKMWKGKA